jgi:DNA-binding response OmpR family regulator
LNNENNNNHVCNTAIIVEDNPTILKFYQKIMTNANFPHKAFLNGKDALN